MPKRSNRRTTSLHDSPRLRAPPQVLFAELKALQERNRDLETLHDLTSTRNDVLQRQNEMIRYRFDLKYKDLEEKYRKLKLKRKLKSSGNSKAKKKRLPSPVVSAAEEDVERMVRYWSMSSSRINSMEGSPPPSFSKSVTSRGSFSSNRTMNKEGSPPPPRSTSFTPRGSFSSNRTQSASSLQSSFNISPQNIRMTDKKVRKSRLRNTMIQQTNIHSHHRSQPSQSSIKDWWTILTSTWDVKAVMRGKQKVVKRGQ